MDEKRQTPWYEDAGFWQMPQPAIFDAERLRQGPTEVYGGLRGTPYDEKAERLVVVGRK